MQDKTIPARKLRQIRSELDKPRDDSLKRLEAHPRFHRASPATWDDPETRVLFPGQLAPASKQPKKT